MTLHEEQERVQKAVRNSLAYVQEDPWLAQRVLAKAKGEEPVKKKISLALVLCIVLALALMGTAYALFSSKVAEFFGEQFGEDLGAWIRGGKVAQVNETDILDSVEFTVDEVVYRDLQLYGVGTARVKDPKDVLLTEGQLLGIDWGTPDPETLELVNRVKDNGGRILSIYCYLREIGVDDGEMMTANEVGVDEEPNKDGSVTFSFESSGYALEEGNTYQLKFSIGVIEWTAEGKQVEREDHEPHYWTVDCAPVFMEGEPEEETEGDQAEEAAAEGQPDDEDTQAAAVTAEPEDRPVAADAENAQVTDTPAETEPAEEKTAEQTPDEEIPAAEAAEGSHASEGETEDPGEGISAVMRHGEMHSDGYELLVPDEYRKTGKMTVYKAVKGDLTEIMQPEWLNQTGILEKRDETIMTFNDHAELIYWPDTLHYEEYTDELFDYNQGDPESDEPELRPKEALSQGIERLARKVYSSLIFEHDNYPGDLKLEHERLTLISLEDAKRTVEGFLEKLNIQGFELAYALDMSLERIQTLAELDDSIYSSYLNNDYKSATAEDEGYFLYYTPLGVTRINNGRQQIMAFVTSRGIVSIQLSNDYNRGEAVDTPELITPEEAVELLYNHAKKGKDKHEVKSIQRVALIYMPLRAENKKQGMVFEPVWQIWYKYGGRTSAWACFNAENGNLIDSFFK